MNLNNSIGIASLSATVVFLLAISSYIRYSKKTVHRSKPIVDDPYNSETLTYTKPSGTLYGMTKEQNDQYVIGGKNKTKGKDKGKAKNSKKNKG